MLQVFLADFLKECDEMSYVSDIWVSLEKYFSPRAVCFSDAFDDLMTILTAACILFLPPT